MICHVCGERMDGNGYTFVLHCPNTKENYYEYEPDANALYCEE